MNQDDNAINDAENNNAETTQKEKFRVQPDEVCVPECDPFKFDHLGREQTAKILTRLISKIKGPCVLAIDAPWGAGKTTFLNMWTQFLRKKQFPVISFNAWENDFTGNPLFSLTAELSEGLCESAEYIEKENPDNAVVKTLRIIRDVVEKNWRKVARFSFVSISSLLAKNIDPSIPDDIVAHVAQKGVDTLLPSEDDVTKEEPSLDEYSESKRLLSEFREDLEKEATKLTETEPYKPLVVIIDELDRCRPTYAIETLEIAKHLFNVDGIVFVLAINISEMAHSIKSLYGSGFDAEGYLRRFIDLDYRLPEATHKLTPVLTKGREKFIIEMLKIIRFKEYCERTKDRFYEQGRELLLHFFRSPSLSLRRVAQSLLRLGMVIEMLSDADHQSFIHTISVLLIIRTADRKLYQRLLRGEATDDKKVANRVMDSLGLQRRPVENNRFNISAYLEAIIIFATQEDRLQNENPRNEIRVDTNLLRWHKQIASEVDTDEATKQYSNNVISSVDYFKNYLQNQQIFILRGSIGFKASAERLELLSPEYEIEPTSA